MLTVNYIFLLNITYVFAIITCLGFLVDVPSCHHLVFFIIVFIAPEDAPANVTILKFDDKLNITWIPPQKPNGVIVMYHVNVTDAEDNEIQEYNTTQTSLVTDSLKYYHWYRISVLAATKIGNGPASTSVPARTDEGRELMIYNIY